MHTHKSLAVTHNAPHFLYMSTFWRELRADSDATRLALYLFVMSAYVVGELTYGFCASKLNSFTHSLHIGLDCGVLFFSVCTMVWAQASALSSFTWSYGLHRWEVLASFANGVFYCFTAFFLFGESITHFLSNRYMLGL